VAVIQAGFHLTCGPSGRPGAVLDENKCETVWRTERQGDTLSQDKAAPFIVNFQMVDTNNDSKVTQDEFMEGCKKGLSRNRPANQSRLAVARRYGYAKEQFVKDVDDWLKTI
jgi:hypothetical protein